MAINPGSRNAAERGLEWWPNALPDSPLWRWMPLLLAIQAQQPEHWRWKLDNANDPDSKNLLSDVLGGNESTDEEKYDLLVMNQWCSGFNQIEHSSSNEKC